MVKQHQSVQPLIQAIGRYWKSYGEFSKLPSGELRTWHKLPQDIQDELQARTRSLFEALANYENIADLQAKNEIATSVLSPQECISVLWSQKKVLIIPWLDLKNVTEDIFSRFCSSLPSDKLIIAITPQINSRECGEMIQRIRGEGKKLILAGPIDVDELAENSWSLTEFINYKVTKIYLEICVDSDAVYSEGRVNKMREDITKYTSKEILTLESAIQKRTEKWGSLLHHPDSDKLTIALGTNNFTLLVGKSASGKSLLALSVAERLQAAGTCVWYVDIGNLTGDGRSTVGISIFLKSLRSKEKVLVILDDLHTQPELAQSLLVFLRFLQNTLFNNHLNIIGICWPEYQRSIEDIVHTTYILPVEASMIREAMIKMLGGNLDTQSLSQIRQQTEGDLFILRLWLETSTKTTVEDVSRLVEKVWSLKKKQLRWKRFAEVERAIFVAYLIGQYECDVPIPFLKEYSGVTDECICELIRVKMLTKKGEVLSPPHRSFAKLIANHLEQKKDIWIWFKSQKFAASIGDIFFKYIEAIHPSQIWSVLKLIESGGAIARSKSSQDHIKMIIDIWYSIDKLLHKIEDQQVDDPSWGRTISSAFFACEALCTVGKFEEARGSIEFIRNCYSIINGRLEIDIKKLSTCADFIEIHDCLVKEEEQGVFPDRVGLENSKQMDMDLFHENWASGLVLGAEACMRPGDPQLKNLAIAVEQRMEKGGYFYPARVPWVSARVLIALSKCERNYENSPNVRKVADWLLKDREDGGARHDNIWLSGTDGWNSVLETTAMVIIALRSVGISNENSVLCKATDEVICKKGEWLKIGKELDGAVALEAYLSMIGDWSQVRKEALQLARWADDVAVWRNATESAKLTKEQSCRAAQVAAFLIKAMWSTLRNDLPQLLIAFGISDNSSNVITNSKDSILAPSEKYEYDVALSFAGEDRVYVKEVAKCLKKDHIRVFYDEFEQSALWGKELYTHLDDIYRKRARFCVMFLSIHYAAKSWTNHERKIAQARAFLENVEYILPVKIDDTEIPGVLPTIGYINANSVTPYKLSRLIQKKLSESQHLRG